MKIVYYTDQIYLHGGLERVLANKLNYFVTHTNIEFHVITFQQKNNPPCYEIPKSVLLHDLAIDYDRELSFLHPSNIKYAFSHYRRLKAKLKEIGPDTVVVCNYEYGFYFIPLILKSALKIKEYHSSRHFNALARQNNTSIFKKAMFKIVDYFESKYDYLVLLTKDELEYYKSDNITVIPNAITTIPAESAELKNKRVISAGRIAPVKGYEKLIAAWQFVNLKYPGWHLDIYGSGDTSYVSELNQQIALLNLNESVVLRGSTENLQKEILNASIFAMSSKTECFPMVLLEAMSCGVPVVSFDCPNGPRNIIRHGEDGLLVEQDNPKALADSIIILIEDNQKRKLLGQLAKSNIHRLSEENVMGEWLRIFNYSNNQDT